VFYIFEVLYCFTLATIKMSIIFFYQRIFTDEKFRPYLHGTQFFNAALCAVYLLVDFVQCLPLSFFWEGWDGEHEGKCININALAWSHAIINIVLDMWMIGLPASQIWGINLRYSKKAQVLAMFSVGIL